MNDLDLKILMEMEFEEQIISDNVLVMPIQESIPQTDKVCYLEESAAIIWGLLKKTGKVREVFDLMLNEYEVDEDVLKNDILNVIQSLKNAGIIKYEG